MAFFLICGPAAGGKTSHIFTLIQESVSKGRRVFYLVPEQSGMEAQKRLLGALEGRCAMGVEALSFQRLSHRILQETGSVREQILTDTGKCMVLIKIARDHVQELTYYKRSVEERGFIGRMKLMITEIIQYGLSEDDLKELELSQPEGSILRWKLHDIRLIWHYFQQYTSDEILSSESVIDAAARACSHSQLLKNADVYIDDFNGFTPQQYRFLSALASRAGSVSVALTISREAFRQAQKTSDWQSLARQPFFTVQKTVVKLISLARDNGLAWYLDWQEKDSRPGELIHAQQTLPFLYQSDPWPQAGRVHAYLGVTDQDEIRFVMHRIVKALRQEHLRCRDIGILVCGLENYRPQLSRAFSLYQIPVFFDQKTEASHEPYVSLIRAMGELEVYGYRQEDMIRVIKSSLTLLQDQTADEVENELLRTGAAGYQKVIRVLEEFAASDMETEKAQSLLLFTESLKQFHEQIRAASSVEEITQAYRCFTKAQRCEERLEEQAENAALSSDLETAFQKRRICSQTEDIFSQLSSVLRQTKVSLPEYVTMLNMGLDQLRLGQIPPSSDEVVVGDFTSSRLSSRRLLILMGVRGGSFPASSESPGLLTDQERRECGIRIEMAQGERERLAEQYYLLYCAIGKAREELLFTACESTSDGKSLGISSLFRRMDLSGEGWKLEDDDEPVPALAMLYESTGPHTQETAAGRALRQYFTTQADQKEQVLYQKIFEQGRQDTVRETTLRSREAVSLMDPKSRILSVTQLEQYASCPFAYYARYGLELGERPVPQVRALEDGTVLHDLLEEAGKYLRRQMDRREAAQLAQKLCEERTARFAVYQSSGRYRYYWSRLQQAAGRAFMVLSRQVSNSSFTPAVFEWQFGSGQGQEEALTLDLPGQQKVRLAGKIDRVDLMDKDGKRYIQIIDYKSGSTSYDPSQVYAGLQLQLPVYLAAGEEAFSAQPAGFFYFHLQPSLSSLEEKDEWPDATDKSLENFQFSRARLDGVCLKDEEIVRDMDKTLRTQTESQMIPAGFTVKNTFQSRSSLMTAQQFSDFTDFALEKARQLSVSMQKGWIAREPVRVGHMTGCDYCAYIRSCPFHEQLPGCTYRESPKLRQQEFLDYLSSRKEGPCEAGKDSES